MDGNDEERSALIHEYYQIYRALQKRHSLREHESWISRKGKLFG